MSYNMRINLNIKLLRGEIFVGSFSRDNEKPLCDKDEYEHALFYLTIHLY